MTVHYTRNKDLNTLKKLASLQRKTYMCFPRNLIYVLTVHRNIKKMFLSEKAQCISLRETHDSIKKLNTLSKYVLMLPKYSM